MIIKFKRLHAKAVIPQYHSDGASGLDLVAIGNYTVHPGEIVKVRTGLAVELPPDCEMQIRPRSGFAYSTPFRIANSPGTIDNDYRGEIIILMENISADTRMIVDGNRVAQAVICPVLRCSVEEIAALSPTIRNTGGFGSTGQETVQ